MARDERNNTSAVVLLCAAGLLAAAVVYILLASGDSATSDGPSRVAHTNSRAAKPGAAATQPRTGSGAGVTDPVMPHTGRVAGAPARAAIAEAVPFAAEDPAHDTAVIPDAYTLTVSGPRTAAVNLAGGKSGVTGSPIAGPAPEQRRFVTGRVQTDAGEPVADAVVLTGQRIQQMWGSLIATHGAATDSRGRFRIALGSIHALEIIAIHPKIGWSGVAVVPAGEADAVVNLAIKKFGGVRGRVQRGGVAVTAALTLAKLGTSLKLNVTSSPDGDYAYPVLAPGRYRLTAKLAQSIGGGVSQPMFRSVQIASGQTATMDFDLPVGVVVAVLAVPPKGTKPPQVEYVLSPAAAAPPSATALKDFLRSPAGRDAKYMMLGGTHSEYMMQFHDIAPGAYSVCVHAQSNDRKTLGAGCTTTTVNANASVHEVTVTLE